MARPDLSYLKNLALVFVGLIVGGWSGLTGMGGAAILAPVLIWLVGLRDRRLTSTVLLATGAAALCALLAYEQAHKIELAAAVVFALFSVAGALVGAHPALSKFRDSRTALVAWACLTVALGMWLMDIASPQSRAFHILSVANQPIGALEPSLVIALSGLLTGIIGRLGNLGGILAVPALLVMCHLPEMHAQATALTVLVIVSIAPSAAYLAQREAPNGPAIACSFGAALGALIGSRYAIAMNPALLVLIYGAGLFVLGAARIFIIWSQPARKQRTSEPSS